MVKGNFKQIDLLRKRRDSNYLLDPYFIDNKKYIKKGIFSGLILITVTLILGIPFIFRTRFLESKKEKIKIFSDEYDLLEKKLDKESKDLKSIAEFNSKLKNVILNISSSEDEGLYQTTDLKVVIGANELGDYYPTEADRVQYSQAGATREGKIINIQTARGDKPIFHTLIVRPQ